MNLVPLFEEALEFQNYNGTVLSNGKVAVFYIGRTRLADIFNDIEGLSPAENPRILDNLGMGPIYVNPAFDYEMVVYDAYDNELFSVKKYVLSKGEHSTANVVVTPSEHIAVSAWTIGDVQVYMPYLVGEVGKVYEGIDPIVVNNDVNRISANHIPLGVQDPLYFVEDSETACVIGFSGEIVPEGVMTESALGFENNKITGYNGSAFSAGNEYEAGNYISIDNNTINVVNLPTSADVQNIVDVATSGLMPSGNYLTKESADTLYAPTGNYLTGLPDDLVYTADITGLATTAQLDEKLDKSESGNFYPMEGNPSGFINELPSDLATTGFVAGVSGNITALIPTGDYLTKESADTLYQPIGQYQSALDFGYVGSEISSINGSGIYSQGGTANPQIPVTSTSGISIFESADKVYFNISADYAFNSDLQSVSAEITGMIPAPFDPTYLSGQIDTKLDSAIYANDSGTFLTALPADVAYTGWVENSIVSATSGLQVSGNYLSFNDLKYIEV